MDKRTPQKCAWELESRKAQRGDKRTAEVERTDSAAGTGPAPGSTDSPAGLWYCELQQLHEGCLILSPQDSSSGYLKTIKQYRGRLTVLLWFL